MHKVWSFALVLLDILYKSCKFSFFNNNIFYVETNICIFFSYFLYHYNYRGQEIQEAGIKYIGMHNEQAASYAAAAVGYLTGRPGACLTVTGPGMIHAVAGMANAQSNCWPMICLSGASERSQDGIGSFQEAKQLLYAHEACKWYNRVPSYQYVPRLIEQAVRYSMAGRPGACYIDLPADVMREAIPSGRGSIEQPPMGKLDRLHIHF